MKIHDLVSWCTLTAWAMAAGNCASSLAPGIAKPSPLQKGGELALDTHSFSPHSLILPLPCPPGQENGKGDWRTSTTIHYMTHYLQQPYSCPKCAELDSNSYSLHTDV